MQNDQETHENNMYLHRMRIEHDENELEREKKLKLTKQKLFKDHVLEQIAVNVSRISFTIIYILTKLSFFVSQQEKRQKAK